MDDTSAQESQASSLPPQTSSPRPSYTPNLPTELLTLIMTSSSNRNATLASLCLVNRNFLRIAQPLLYHKVHVRLAQEYSLTKSTDLQGSVGTLLSSQRCAKLVKILSADCSEASSRDMVTFAYLLSQLGEVVEVKASREGSWVAQEIIEDFLEAVRRHGPDIKHLRPPEPIDDSSKVSLKALEASLPHLEIYDGNTNDETLDQKNPPLFHLRQLVVTSSLKQSSLAWIASSSINSLTSLTFLLADNPLSAVSDLSSLRNLSTLCIVVDYKSTSLPLDAACLTRISDPSIRKCLRTLLSTAASLPLGHFCLVAPLRYPESLYDGTAKREPLVMTGGGVAWPGNQEEDLDLVVYASKSIQPFKTFAIPDALDNTESWEDLTNEGASTKDMLELDKVEAVKKYGLKIGISFQGREVLPLFERAMDREEEGDSEMKEEIQDEKEEVEEQV